MNSNQIAFGAADLTNCDREQIHAPGSVQPHGALLVLEPQSLVIVQAGGDMTAVPGAGDASLLGRSMQSMLDPAHGAQLRAAADAFKTIARPNHLFSLVSNGMTVDATVHASGRFLLLELEPRREADPQDSLGLVQDMILRVQNTRTIPDAYDAAAQAVRAACGFDRVMVYRFLGDGTGSVEAEARGDDNPSYLGLRYPASDIPRQARALYLCNGIRVIPDTRYTPSMLLSAPGEPSLDLSLCALRSVSPIHLEYLANMGVAASMSLSLIVDGALWGLIACHHQSPRFPSCRTRAALELFAQMASFQIETKLEAANLGSRLRQKTIGETLVTSLSGNVELTAGLRKFQPELLNYVEAGGVGLWVDGQFSAVGKTPNSQEMARLVRWLNETVTDGVFHTDRLCELYPAARSFADTASGILALSVSRTPRDYVIWFKPEVIQTVTWAGDPNKPVLGDDERISPRKSFAAWKQTVRLQCEPWTGLDVRTAQSLRVSLLEVVLEHTDQLAREQARSRIQQQALMAQLDQRIAQWEQTARELKRESDRRALLETELSQVLRRTVLDQEAERQRIARELHDSLGQYLTVMRLDLDGIGRDTGASGSIRARVEKLKSLTTDVGQEVNQLAWEIRPTALDDLGLQKAFQQFLEEWAERSTLKFDLHLALNDRRLPPQIETALYRVLQEAIRNVVQHAQAAKVGVILEASSGEVRLIVEDDGKGFVWDARDGDAPSAPRLGLLGIRERLALVGGLLEIETAPGAGTTLLIHVPL